MKMFFLMRYVPALLLAFAAAPMAHAATAPSLGDAASFSVLAGLSMSSAVLTTISGDLGLSPGLAVSRTGVWVVGGTEYFGPASLAADAQTDASAASINLASQPSSGVWASASPPPGVWTIALDTTFAGPTLTLNGSASDVWVFQIGQDMTFTGNVVLTGGAQPCNVFWQIGRDATITADSNFVGTLIASRDITLASGADVNGRLISLTSSLTAPGAAHVVSGPTCAAIPAPSGTVAPLINVEKVPTPLNLPAGPGQVTYNYTVNNPGQITLANITLTDDKCSNVVFLSGDMNGNALLETSEEWRYSCTTNLAITTVNFATARGEGNGMSSVDTAIAQVTVGIPVVPPLINIVKTPNPLTLPFGGGSVAYSFAVTNPGTVALSNVTVIDDKCSNIIRVSGDSNSNNLLEVSETWTFSCTANVPISTVNSVVATGQANGLTAVDTALASVVVAGTPLPPLINLVKAADPVILPAGGGSVAYTFTVTNPGTFALSNVSVTDNQCGPVTFVSGDGNGNGLMETAEIWIYSCQRNVSASNVNTATASGTGNGITVTALSAASVTVLPPPAPVVPPPPVPPPTPTLPNTGVGPSPMAWMIASAGILAAFIASVILFARAQRKRRS